MGPSPTGDGECCFTITPTCIVGRFNGAVANRRRRVIDRGVFLVAGDGFNGAVANRRRRVAVSVRDGLRQLKLQWGRRQQATESRRGGFACARRGGFNGAVANRRRREPILARQSDARTSFNGAVANRRRRGISPASVYAIRDRLQWGRRQQATESVGRIPHTRHWGRFNGAVANRRRRVTDKLMVSHAGRSLLQWGRRQQATERTLAPMLSAV